MSTGRPTKKAQTEMLKASVSPLLKRGIEHLVRFVSPHHSWNTLAVQWLEERLVTEFGAKTALELKAKIEALDDPENEVPFSVLQYLPTKTVTAIMVELNNSSEEQEVIERIPQELVLNHAGSEALSNAIAKHSVSQVNQSTAKTNDNI